MTFTVASIPGREFASTISFVDPLVNPQTRTAAVRAEVANPGLILKPDMFINAKVKNTISIEEKSLLIPKSALLWTGARSVVYVEVSEGGMPAFEMREITLGARSGDYYTVVAGLNPGDKVVVNGVFAIDAAAQLSGNYSMMNRPADSDSRDFGDFTAQLTDIVDAYFDIKNGLVDSNVGKSTVSARNLSELLKATDSSLLTGEALETWKDWEKQLQSSLKSFVSAKDLNAQRELFGTLSDTLISAVGFFGANNRELYINHCPMAQDGNGAHWLSEFEEVKNPYFGEAMMNCGDVVKKFPPSKELKGKGLPAKGSSPSIGHFH